MASCKDCFDNCAEIVSDKCIKYTGPEVELLGICPGDTLSAFENSIVTQLLLALEGTNILPKDLTLENCDWLKDQMGILPLNVKNILQLLIDSSCTLKAMIDAINIYLSESSVFNTACLSGLPANPSQGQVLQSAVNLLCIHSQTINALPTTYVKQSDFNTLVTQIVNGIMAPEPDPGSDQPVVNQQYIKAIPYVAMEYYGPLSNFDSAGKGLSTLGWDKIYLCNGQNGTPDRRGRVAVGAVRSVPGGSLDTAVDPNASPMNPNYAVLDKYGKTFETLAVTQIPQHTHTVIDPGHIHSVFGQIGGDDDTHSNTTRFAGGDKNANETNFNFVNSTAVQKANTGITIASAGGGQPHNNVQPSIAAYYIMYIP